MGGEHLFRLMESIPVDITSPTAREPEYTFTRGSAYWPFTLNTARKHWSKFSHDTNHLHLQYSTLHTTHYAELTSTNLHHSIRHNVGPCLHVCECVSACINVFDPDINSEGTKLSSLPLTDVKTGLITTRTCCWIIWRLLWCLSARPCSLPFEMLSLLR